MTQEFNPKTVIRITMLPPSFNEYGLFKFFSQFGPVLRVKVARSPKTMRSCGVAYVEFDDPVVAEQAALAIDNYLVSNSILKVEQLEKCGPGVLAPVRPDNSKQKFIEKRNVKLTEESRQELIEKLNKIRENWCAKIRAANLDYVVDEVVVK